jgi:hypothetical protein
MNQQQLIKWSEISLKRELGRSVKVTLVKMETNIYGITFMSVTFIDDDGTTDTAWRSTVDKDWHFTSDFHAQNLA